MEINFSPGRKKEGVDIVMHLSCFNEQLSLSDFVLIKNFLGINEKKINKVKIENGRFVFLDLMKEIDKDIEVGIDYFKEENFPRLKLLFQHNMVLPPPKHELGEDMIDYNNPQWFEKNRWKPFEEELKQWQAKKDNVWRDKNED